MKIEYTGQGNLIGIREGNQRYNCEPGSFGVNEVFLREGGYFKESRRFKRKLSSKISPPQAGQDLDYHFTSFLCS